MNEEELAAQQAELEAAEAARIAAEAEATQAEADRIAAEAAQAARIAEQVTNNLRPAQATTTPLDPYSQAQADADSQGIYDEKWITQRAIVLAMESTRAQVTSELTGRYEPLYANAAVREIAGDDPVAAEYVEQQRALGADLANPAMRNLVSMAAKAYSAEKTPQRKTIGLEPNKGEVAPVIPNEARLTANNMLSITAAKGYNIQLSDKDIQEAMNATG